MNVLLLALVLSNIILVVLLIKEKTARHYDNRKLKGSLDEYKSKALKADNTLTVLTLENKEVKKLLNNEMELTEHLRNENRVFHDYIKNHLGADFY